MVRPMSAPIPPEHDAHEPAAATGAAGHILVDHELEALVGGALRATSGAAPITREQLQPASMDLRLGPVAYRIRASFVPERASIEQRLERLTSSSLSLEGEGAVLERGMVYMVPLEEELDLPPELSARFNPRSSAGRCDLFVRALVPGHPRFDESPVAWSGRPWLEVAPLSFPVRLRRGDRLAQLRLVRGRAGLTAEELRAAHAESPLCFVGARPLAPEELIIDEEGALLLRVGLTGREPCAWRAAAHTDVLRFASRGAHAAEEFWDPIRAREGRCVLAPGRFYLCASRERLSVPPSLAAEMLPVDLGLGELRNNYAGFFDSGFGWEAERPAPGTLRGTPAVLEVRAHDVPFEIEDGQVLFRLRYFRTSGPPRSLYGRGRRGPSYRGQDLTLARVFRAPSVDRP